VSASTSTDTFAAGLLAELDRWHPQGNDAGKEQRRLLARRKRTICSRVGPDSTARLVGLVLVGHMLNLKGDAPSQERLAAETGLSRKAVGEALRRLLADHWLTAVTTKRPGRGARGEGFRYAVTVPKKVAAARGTGELRFQFQRRDQTPKPPFRDVETLDSGPKSPQNGIVRDVVIDGAAPC